MTTRDKRKHVRIKRFFEAKLSKAGTSHSIAGQTENVSQGGAFIKTKDWHSLKPNDKTTLTVFLPPLFTGQDATIGLQGSAIINRVDEENEGVAVEFLQNFKQFERIEEMEIPGKIRYKHLAPLPLRACLQRHLPKIIPTVFWSKKHRKAWIRMLFFSSAPKK
jgi:hypothetical protein